MVKARFVGVEPMTELQDSHSPGKHTSRVSNAFPMVNKSFSVSNGYSTATALFTATALIIQLTAKRLVWELYPPTSTTDIG